MDKNTTIAVIGYGYWGKIIFNNLKTLGFHNIQICDPFHKEKKYRKNYKDICPEHVFVCVPANVHYEICSHFLKVGSNVFCEKPLAPSFLETEKLYKISKKHKKKLFVDWIFTFNDHVNFIKNICDSKQHGKLLSVTMNRLNMGPERKDVNAKYDLSSHDVSIMTHILEKMPSKTLWINYKRNKESIKSDSAIGLLDFSGTLVQINSSWYYGKKDRDCIFEFENAFLYWDDITQTLKVNDHTINIKFKSPLLNSIESFFSDSFNFKMQEKLTKQISKILEHEGPF